MVACPGGAVRFAAKRCPACLQDTVAPSFATRAVQVARCRRCGHRIAQHSPVPKDGRDYHEQFEAGAFLESLRATRLRQAAVTLREIRRLDPDATRLLDLGCGRGWFVDMAIRSGFGQVAGADTSRVAVESVRRLGAHAVLLTPEDASAALTALPFRPQVLTVLDVLEHFDDDTAVTRLSSVVDLFRPELRLVVVKVPVSSGILYRTASVLRALGSPTALEQLYQVGTTPPHVHYFNAGSAALALRRAGLEVAATSRDIDFEPASLTARARAARALPSAVGGAVGTLFAASAKLLGWQDSLVLFARPAAHAP